MTAKDFRIGNYVTGNDKNTHTIEEISKMVVKSQSIIGNSNSAYNNPILPTPIRLTDKWLQALGFTKSLHEVSNISSDHYWVGKISLFVYKDDGSVFLGNLTEDGCDPVVDVSGINYIHELQNLQYALTGIELLLKNQ
jgi:hypothetical protein